MDFQLNEDQKMIKESASSYAKNSLAPKAYEFDEKEEIPISIYKELAELGYFGIMVPEEWGGCGFDTISYVCIIEELAKVCAAITITLSVHNSLVCEAILRYGTKEQKEKYLKKLAKGEIIGAYSLTEPSSGTDAGSLKATALLKDDYYILNGVKTFCSNAGFADIFVVFALTEPSLKSKGISAFLVEKGKEGFEIGKKEKKMGMRGSDTREISFSDCKIPKDALLGNLNEGFKIALSLLDNGRIGIAAQSLGIAQASFEEALKYSKERIQFSQPISNFQAIQFKLADIATQIEAGRWLLYHAAWLKDKGLKHTKESSMAKLFTSELANKVADEAVQIYGGYGYIREYPVERYFRDARVTKIYEGTSEAQRIVISRDILK